MFLEEVVSDAFGTKCRLLANQRGGDCVVVDPGIGVVGGLKEKVEAYGLSPRAVLLTHGHLDHTCSAAAVCAAYGIPAYIHPGDSKMLADPHAGLGPEFSPQFRRILGPEWRWEPPNDVLYLKDGEELNLAGLELIVEHAPGHTPGSVIFNLPRGTDDASYCLVGDVLYAGSIGRTDMPGGSRQQTLRSLREKVLTKDDATILLTGHGRDSTVGVERDVNPFMRQAAALVRDTRSGVRFG
ncbi:MBL fold metallo-hydrolase [Nocardiopsis sp. M1B1]|uniref:MBL fold metallo-hydrolase n=1 Tax=Nocardiopsis sp. M1B1 TaxID=3450454 RepID=UPI004039E972